MPPHWSSLLLCLLWLGAVGWGFFLAATYQSAPGQQARGDGAWPVGVSIPLDPALATLVLAAHPHCPCTHATLRELDRLVLRCGGRMRVHVLFYTDPELGTEWAQSELWTYAQSIPGVELVADPLGETAARFGARTSGQVFLFGADGRLLFEGGITAARGHEGDNAGAEAVGDLVLRGRARTTHTPVFGCALSSGAESGA